ncbi:DEAD/DEAH box helicase [[Brevibacterium] frigoritolerans]|uniref:DEAD/DEAH box helicase n=1 Tax=Peribacillus frigoritolerans TaxID=450367 RepID=A0A941J8W1_9BACI|nr:DEAD/DEAH box helicase [Peribacillus frigoritolerans]
MMNIERVLKEKFGFDEFRPGQKEVVESLMSGRHTLAMLPTGSGKSLCYQLPAYLVNKTVIIVSPVIIFNAGSSGSAEDERRKKVY